MSSVLTTTLRGEAKKTERNSKQQIKFTIQEVSFTIFTKYITLFHKGFYLIK